MTEQTDRTVAGIMGLARRAELVYAAVVSSAQHEGTIAADIRTAYDNERIALESAVAKMVRERDVLRSAASALVRAKDEKHAADKNYFYAVPGEIWDARQRMDHYTNLLDARWDDLRAALAAGPAGEEDR